MFQPLARRRQTYGAVDLDGSTHYWTRGGGLTGAADSKQGLFSAWVTCPFLQTAGDQIILAAVTTLGGATYSVLIYWDSLFDLFRIILKNSASGNIGVAEWGAAPNGPNSDLYSHVAASWDLNASVLRFVLNGINCIGSNPLIANDTVDLTMADWSIGALANGANKYTGSIAEVLFTNQYLDINTLANYRKLATARGEPANLGVDGSAVTGTAPLIYMTRRPGEAASAFVNKGTGGTFTPNGTLVADSRSVRWPTSPFVLQSHVSTQLFNFIGLAYSSSLALFVAVSQTSLNNLSSMTSSDGITWTERNLLNSGWFGVHWASTLGLFIALRGTAATQGAATSPDGINWTVRTTPNGSWEELAWSPSLTLAVAAGFGAGQIMTSPDGINWTSRTAADAAAAWTGITWSPSLGLFCACSFNGTGNGNLQRIMTSPDGINWTIRNASIVGAWQEVEWSAELGLFVCVGDGKIMTSPDGINWTTRTVVGQVGTPDYRDIAAVGAPMGGIIVVGQHSTNTDCGVMYMARSKDGINWTALAGATEGGFRRIADANDQKAIICVGLGNGGAVTPAWAATRRPVQLMRY